MISKAWRILRLKKWLNGSGRNWNRNVPVSARSLCTRHRLPGAFIAGNNGPQGRGYSLMFRQGDGAAERVQQHFHVSELVVVAFVAHKLGAESPELLTVNPESRKRSHLPACNSGSAYDRNRKRSRSCFAGSWEARSAPQGSWAFSREKNSSKSES